MIRRLTAERLLRQRLVEYPAVALVGPRQCGKTTLARGLGGRYFDLEQEAERLRLDLEWNEVVDTRAAGRDAEPVILDEAQSWPELFARVRGSIDAQRDRRGRFLILGSVSPALMHRVSESLAGRLSVVELSPFTVTELAELPLRRLWLHGGFPDGGPLDPRRFPQWQLDYLQLLVARDLPNWGLPARPQLTERLLRMLAAVNGQLWNASQIGKSLGISYATVNGYMDYLEGAYLVRRLPPFHANLKKRLVKSPKCYWRDSGLLHAVLRTSSEADMLAQPWVGASWEGFVIEQAHAALAQRGRLARTSYLRTSDGFEIDLILELERQVWAVEVKLTTAPKPGDFERLERAADLIGAQRRILVSLSAETLEDERRLSCGLAEFLARLHVDSPR